MADHDITLVLDAETGPLVLAALAYLSRVLGCPDCAASCVPPETRRRQRLARQLRDELAGAVARMADTPPERVAGAVISGSGV